jgi:hypothetical protein
VFEHVINEAKINNYSDTDLFESEPW